MDMGFEEEAARQTLLDHKVDENAAVEALLRRAEAGVEEQEYTNWMEADREGGGLSESDRALQQQAPSFLPSPSHASIAKVSDSEATDADADDASVQADGRKKVPY